MDSFAVCRHRARNAGREGRLRAARLRPGTAGSKPPAHKGRRGDFVTSGVTSSLKTCIPGPQPERAGDSRIVAWERSYRNHLEIIRAVYAPSQKLLHIAGMPLKTESHVILSADLQCFAGALFVAAGVAPAMADEWAKSLVWANLRGVDSHGVLRIPGYIERLGTNAINPTPNMRVEKRAGAIALLEADRAPGAVAMAMAMTEAMARAREVHVGWCAARNITHAGAVGYFALQAANAGMVGIVMSASGPMMAYHGAKAAGVSSNPLAIAFPAENRPPLLLDMSTSNVAMGKVMSARL